MVVTVVVVMTVRGGVGGIERKTIGKVNSPRKLHINFEIKSTYRKSVFVNGDIIS